MSFFCNYYRNKGVLSGASDKLSSEVLKMLLLEDLIISEFCGRWGLRGFVEPGGACPLSLGSGSELQDEATAEGRAGQALWV